MGFKVVRSCESGTAGVKWVNLVMFVLLHLMWVTFPSLPGAWRPVDFLSVCLLPALPEFRSLLCVLWLYMQQHLESPVPSLCTWLPKKVVIQSDLNILPFSPSEPPSHSLPDDVQLWLSLQDCSGLYCLAFPPTIYAAFWPPGCSLFLACSLPFLPPLL